MLRILVFVLCLALSAPAMAHVTANPNTGEAGKYFETAFRVSHGCDGDPTIAVTVMFPKGIVIAKPQYKPGWLIRVKKNKLAKPVIAGHSKMVDEEFESITWSGIDLPDDQYDTFGVLMKLPEEAGTLYFPVIQQCRGGRHKWIQIPAQGQSWGNLKSPAPFVKVQPSVSSGHKH
jgi:uncharacterized protein YcnI